MMNAALGCWLNVCNWVLPSDLSADYDGSHGQLIFRLLVAACHICKMNVC